MSTVAAAFGVYPPASLSPWPAWHPLFVQDVLQLAAQTQRPLAEVVSFLDRDTAPGTAIAQRLQRAAGYPVDLWLRAAMPDAAESLLFLEAPNKPNRLRAIDAVRYNRGIAGGFWRSPNLENYADDMVWPVPLLCHVITGRLGLRPYGVTRYLGLDPTPDGRLRTQIENIIRGRLTKEGRMHAEHPLAVRIPGDTRALQWTAAARARFPEHTIY